MTLTNDTYHIYYDGKVLFKNLDQEEFDVVWGRIYRSYHMDKIEYVKCDNDDLTGVEQSY